MCDVGDSFVLSGDPPSAAVSAARSNPCFVCVHTCSCLGGGMHMNVRVHAGQRSASGVSPLPALLGGMKRHTQDLASRSDSQNHIVKAAVLDNRGFWGGQTPALTLGLRGHLGAEGAAPPLRVTVQMRWPIPTCHILGSKQVQPPAAQSKPYSATVL